MAATKKNETKTAVKAEKEGKAVVSEAAKAKAPAAAAPVKEEPKKAAEKKETAPKKAEEKKTEAPARKAAKEKTETARKAPVRAAKKEVKPAVFVQFAGREISAEALIAEAKKAYAAAGHKESEIRTLEVYVKPEESAAYYVVNGEGSDDYKIVY